MEGYLGEIRLFSGYYAPEGWAFCDGAHLPISEYKKLYELISGAFHGDAFTHFTLPDIRGRLVVGNDGKSMTLEPYKIIGSETVVLEWSNLPSHTHQVETEITATVTPNAMGDSGGTNDPKNNYFAITDSGTKIYSGVADGVMAANTVTINADIEALDTGGSGAHNNIMPVTALNYIICIDGFYPSKD